MAGNIEFLVGIVQNKTEGANKTETFTRVYGENQY